MMCKNKKHWVKKNETPQKSWKKNQAKSCNNQSDHEVKEKIKHLRKMYKNTGGGLQG